MPLLYVDLIEGRSPAEIRTLLDAIHDAVVEAFGVPPRDRYQLVRTDPSHEIVVWDTGLGIERSAALVVVHMVSRRRSPEMKQRFYELVAANLAARCALYSADLVGRSPITTTTTGLSAMGGHSSSPESSHENPAHRVLRHRPPDCVRADGAGLGRQARRGRVIAAVASA